MKRFVLAILFSLPFFSNAGLALRELASMVTGKDANQRQLTMVTYQTVYGTVVTETLTPEQYYQLKVDCALNSQRQLAAEQEWLAKQQENLVRQQEKEARKEEKANRQQIKLLERKLEIESLKNEINETRRKLDKMFFITRNDFEREYKHQLKRRIHDLEDRLEELKKKKRGE
ncbi:MAG: hypothetical protein MJ202_05035 [Lentisphaeria bacterium]|nr:hypothetical protein [Lentisphaeria bacterium]